MFPAAQAVVLRVCPDPEPEQPVGCVDGQGAVVQTDAHGMEALHAFKAERRMLRIGLEERELLVREFAHHEWERSIAHPETR